MVTPSKFHTKNPHILDAIVYNLYVTDNHVPGICKLLF